MSNDCFRLKGSVLTTFILELHDDSDEFGQQLKNKVDATPEFFQQSPVIIDCSKLDPTTTDINYSDIVSVCRDNGLQPIAFKYHPDLDLSAVKPTKLAVIEHNSKQTDKAPAENPLLPANDHSPKIINKPVRSGQQIYAKDRDLIVIGSVSGGAEVLADGNIHVYGSLRGRALAGVTGNHKARIFCSSNEAELVSITGHFLVSHSHDTATWKKPAQFYLEDDTLHVVSL
ncbi:MAG: septum site-determining protein MinC [Gammaproteobacteria bacterium]|nr:septum site-determining protein MinC [Gammaproteobacteria bacterium]